MSEMTVSMCESVEGSVGDIVRLLEGRPSIVRAAAAAAGKGAEVSVGPCEFVHRRMAALDVHLGHLNISLRLLPVVGGVKHPVTELLVVVRGTGNGVSGSRGLARQFLGELTRRLSEQLRTPSAA